MREAGEVPAGAEADVKQGDALQLPFADGEFDRVVAAEVLEHIHADVDAIKELVRVLRPGGTLAISVPRWLPEVINWKLSDDYHNAEGGHIRIYTDHELIDKVTKAGRFNDGTPGDAMVFEGKDYAHGLHSPYWWIKCAVGVNNDDHPLAKAYHKLLVWEIMKQPKVLQVRRQGARPADRQEHGALLPQARPRRTAQRDGPRPAAVRRRRARPRPGGGERGGHRGDAGAVRRRAVDGRRARRHLEPRRGRRWRCSSAARSRPPSAPTPGCRPCSARDGSWPMKIVDGAADDERGEVNMSAYLAVGIWHHWLVRRDLRFVQRFWPSVRAGLDWVVAQQLPFGGIRWTPTEEFALLAGSSSIYQSLRAGVALAELLDDPQPEWELAGGRLGHAVREHRDLFEDKSTYSMDWYYPVLGGAGPRPRGVRAARVALGRVRRARPRHPLRRHQPVGDRRRDLRARDGARRDRRPPSRADAAQGHAAPARVATAATGPAGCTTKGATTRASRATSTGRSSTRPTPPPR